MLALWPATGRSAQLACDTPSYDARYCRFEVNGWTVEMNADLIAENATLARTTLDVLNEQLTGIVAGIPPARLVELRRILIWIEPKSPGKEQQLVHHPTTSPWPQENGYPLAMRGSIAIRNAKYFVDRRQSEPSIVMHELAHAYHEIVLGFDDRSIANAFEHANQTGLYQSVAYNRGQPRRAYALTNHKEYFAELSEAYFGTNDFFPFTRADLQAYDPIGFAAVSTAWEDTVPVAVREAKGIDHACESDSVASPGSDHPSRLAIRNMRTEPVKLNWIDLKGVPRYNRTIAPGALGSLSTKAGHRFVISDANDKCLATATAERAVLWIDVLP
jgi:hypothetical protein